MNKLKITTGEWVPVNYGGYYEIQNTGKYNGDDLLDASVTPRAGANISLCCDAGNTYQKCGLLPSELLEQRDKMIEVLNELQTYIRLVGVNKSLPISLIYKKITELTDSIEKHENETK